MYKNLSEQLCIINETVSLMDEAAAGNKKLTFSEALEIIKIQRLEQLAKSVDGVSKELYNYL